MRKWRQWLYFLFDNPIKRPDRTINAAPTNIENETTSPKKNTPSITPKISRVYLKGVTAEISPVRIAIIKQE